MMGEILPTIRQINADLGEVGLRIAGTIEQEAERPGAPSHLLILAAPSEDFWSIVTASPEWADGTPDPIDRWSRRVLTGIAEGWKGEALFPFGGPPWHPFHDWALMGGDAFRSPVGLLVDTTDGLWISYRGAVRIPQVRGREGAEPPCPTCPQPCRTACPVGALTDKGYDVPACKAFIETEAGHDCREGGCLVRRACPVGPGRMERARAAYHMGAFRGA